MSDARNRILVALLLAAFTIMLLFLTAPQMGLTWPEGAASVFNPARAEGCPLAIGEADYVVLQHRQTEIDAKIENCVRGRTPVYRLSRQRIPLLDIYER